MNSKTKGFIYGAIAAASYGMNPLFALPLYAAGMSVDTVLFYRYFFATIVLGILMKMQHQSFALHKADVLPLVIMGLLFSFSSLLLFMSYNYMDAGIASTILFVYPVMVAVIMGIFFKEKISAITVFSILLALSGIALLYQGDGNKAIFYYIADERVDFRQLIKVLAETFRVRIEMKQIGARQEAGRIGGIGPCGRELCCSSWMTSFVSVATGAARYQDISMNPQKLAGQCAKLKCCINYEVDTYVEAQKRLPSREIVLETKDNNYYHFKTDIFKREITYSTDKSFAANLITIPASRAFDVINMNKKGMKPISLEADTKPQPPKRDAQDILGQESVTRFDSVKKKKKKRPANKNNGENNGNGNGANTTATAVTNTDAPVSENKNNGGNGAGGNNRRNGGNNRNSNRENNRDRENNRENNKDNSRENSRENRENNRDNNRENNRNNRPKQRPRANNDKQSNNDKPANNDKPQQPIKQARPDKTENRPETKPEA